MDDYPAYTEGWRILKEWAKGVTYPDPRTGWAGGGRFPAQEVSASEVTCADHEWGDRGTPGNYWRECWLCGADEDVDDQVITETFSGLRAHRSSVATDVLTCLWFALCGHTAIGTSPHPILGAVPICQRCADNMGLTVSPLPPERTD